MIPSGPIRTGQTSVPQTVPSPIGGLNGRDPLAQMDRTDAYVMDNWLPGTASVDTRNGCEEYVAPLGGAVQALEVYAGAAGDILLAFANGKVFDISTSIPAELATGHMSNLVIGAMFSNAADTAQHLILVNGIDTPFHHDGTTIANLTITGVTGGAATLNYAFGFKARMYFAQKDKLGFYYLAVGAIQGAAAFFDLSQVSVRGGYLVAIDSYSQDSGNGINDYIVFITSKGECIVYSGYDPSSADNWVKVGSYFAGTPIGKKCTVHYASELVLITLEGAVPFSQIKAAGDAKTSGVAGVLYSALTAKLGKFLSALNINRDVPGWCGLQYSLGNWLIISAPATTSQAGAYYHFVMNTVTNAWSRITNWDGLSLVVYNRRLYFGRNDGRVMLGDEGKLDDGQPIRCDVKQAYNYFEDGSGVGFLQKHYQWASLLVSCDGEPPLSASFNVDYVEKAPQYANSLTSNDGSEWDIPEWDEGVWAADETTQRFIATINKGGVAGALNLRAQLDGLTLRWFATQTVFEKTKGLLI